MEDELGDNLDSIACLRTAKTQNIYAAIAWRVFILCIKTYKFKLF